MAIDIINKHLKKAKAEHFKSRHTGFLMTAINTGLWFAQKYYWLTTENLIYAPVVVLNLTQKGSYFHPKWIETEKQARVTSFKEKFHDTLVIQYSNTSSEALKSPVFKQ